MNTLLLIKSFEEANKKLSTDTITRLSKNLSEFIQEDSGEPYGERILRDKFNKIKNNDTDKIELKGFVQEALSHFLGYESYAHFIMVNEEINEIKKIKTKKKGINFLKKNIFVIIASLIVLTAFIIYQSSTKQKWMIWENDHYMEVEFNAEKLKKGTLKIYKEERINYFIQVYPDSTYQFFTPKGDVKIWYGKNINKEYEFFTDLGRHPETGKTLKPITAYMIEKHICPTWGK